MEFPLKLLSLRQDLGLTQEEMAVRLGLSPNYISLLEKGRKDPSDAVIRHLELIERLHRSGMEAPGDPYLQQDQPPLKLRMIPVLGWAHAGHAANYDEIPQDWQERVPCSIRDEKAFAVRLEGDSMEPKYSAGDLLILEPSGEFSNGCLAVIKMTSDDFLFRRVERRTDFLRLIPLNPQWPSEDLPHSEVQWVYPVWGMWRQITKRD